MRCCSAAPNSPKPHRRTAAFRRHSTPVTVTRARAAKTAQVRPPTGIMQAPPGPQLGPSPALRRRGGRRGHRSRPPRALHSALRAPRGLPRGEPVPVLTADGIADGIADGCGVAAAVALGGAGALIGTRFQASAEALVAPSISKATLEGRGQDTERSSVWTSPAARAGRPRSTPPVPSPTPTDGSSGGRADRRSLARQGYQHDVAQGVIHPCRSGRTKASVSSPICLPLPPRHHAGRSS